MYSLNRTCLFGSACLVLVVGGVMFFSKELHQPIILESPPESPQISNWVEPASVEPTIEIPTSENLPAPAKKLNQVVSNIDNDFDRNHSLEGKIQHLNQQLAEINEQLKAQGIQVPEQNQAVINSSDVLARVKLIRERIDNKSLLKN